MKYRLTFLVFHVAVFLASFVAFACSEEDNPAANPECGSGRVFWDDKTGCRDIATNAKVPDSCCGR